MKQRLLEPDRRVEWCAWPVTPTGRTTVSHSRCERKGETLVMFSQDYARELSDEVYGIYNFNWGYYLNSLKLLCEKGSGVPFTPPS